MSNLTPTIQEELDLIFFTGEEIDDEFIVNVFRKLYESNNNDIEATLSEINTISFKCLGEHLDEFFLQEVNNVAIEKCVEWAPGAYLILNDSKDENSIFMSDPMLNLILADGEQLQWPAILANYNANKDQIINYYAAEVLPDMNKNVTLVLECIRDGYNNAEIVILKGPFGSETQSSQSATNNSSPKPTL